jgi:Predicted nucleoside-diphosphate-sugar epimerases
MCASSGNVERHNDPRHSSHRPCGGAVVCRLASLGHDVVAMVREIQAASRRLPSGIALRVADYEDASALKRTLAGINEMVLISSDGDSSAVTRQHHRGSHGNHCRPRTRELSRFPYSINVREQAFLNLPYPVGYASCIVVIDHMRSLWRSDALHIAAIRRCLRYAAS